MKAKKIVKPKGKKELRMAVAKDVLLLLSKGLGAQAGVYLDMGTRAQVTLEDKTAQEVPALIPKVAKNCRVCAKGAMLLAYVHMYDGFNYDDLADCEVSRKTEQLFGVVQASLIEHAFESYGYDGDYRGDYRLYHLDAYDFSDRISSMRARGFYFGAGYPTARARMRAIMKNIIENGGDFVPPSIPEKELVKAKELQAKQQVSESYDEYDEDFGTRDGC